MADEADGPPSIAEQLGQLLERCAAMAELQQPCEDLLERLLRAQGRLDDRPSSNQDDGIQARLGRLGLRFLAFLTQHGHKSVFERLVSARTLLAQLHRFHADVAVVEEAVGASQSWDEAWAESEQQVETLLQQLWRANAGAFDDLCDASVQSDALLLLSSEMARSDYSAKSREVLEAATTQLVRLSGVPVPAVPAWFIPEHEVQRELRPFARGGFGEVFRGTWGDRPVVIKCVSVRSQRDKRTFLREARIWHMAEHRHIVQFYGACHLSDPCFFLCEEAANGNLVDFLDAAKPTRPVVWRLLSEVASGLQFLHRNGIVHGDLKCNQILVSRDGVAKLTDFGLSFISDESRPLESTGSIRWKAPECLVSADQAPTTQSDLYSFGMCIVEALTELPPWGIHLPDAIVIDHLRRREFLPQPDRIDGVEWDLVLSLCAFEPSKRASLASVMNRMQKFVSERIALDSRSGDSADVCATGFRTSAQQPDGMEYQEKAAEVNSTVQARAIETGKSQTFPLEQQQSVQLDLDVEPHSSNGDSISQMRAKAPTNTGGRDAYSDSCQHTSSDTKDVAMRFSLASTLTPLSTSSKEQDVRMWVGTWNMGAVDPFDDGNELVGAQRSAAMLQSFLPRGYHLYILGVQEGASENVYHAVWAYLNGESTSFSRLELKNNAVGISKSTGIAVYYSAAVQDTVKLICTGTHKFGLTSGSKGGVAVALAVNHTTITFVNCHLDAKSDESRREQIRNLNASLGREMGHSSFDLTEQFHHVVWMGDMSYRIVSLDPEVVLHMLDEGRNLEIHDKFDGLLTDRRSEGVFEGFTEPNKFPDFYPTCEKFPRRGVVNESLPLWPSIVYRTLFKEPFYKGGKVKRCVPGWSDRILTHSLLVADSKLTPEKIFNPLSIEQPPRMIDNYRSVNHGDGMDISDHSPVYGTFVLSFIEGHRSKAQNRPVSTVLRVFNMHLVWNDNQVVPQKTRIVAPLVGEDGKQCDVMGERCAGANGMNLSLNAVIQHSRPLEQLHMLIWVKNGAVTGHCTLSLKRVARQDAGGEVKYRVPLYNASTRLFFDGHPLLLVFSVRSKTFSK